MPLPEKSFDELVSDQVNAMQAVAQRLLDFSTGSVMLAIVESNAGNSIWLEALVAYLLSITRLQTSHGENVDTFVEQFGLYRLPATPAFGEVTFSRSDTSQAAVIQAGELDLSTQGQLVYSPSNQITYSVYADPDNPAYNPDINAYVLIVGNESVTVPVVALTPGSVGNVLAGQITIISTPINYVSSVTNENSFATGQDQESDAALKLRFVLYINSLSKATEQSLEETIESVPGVARYNLVENEDIDGNDDIGFFYAVIDDGSGNASPELLANVQLAVYADRGLTIAFSIYEPEQLEVDFVVHAFTDGSVPEATVQAAIETALANYLLSRTFKSLLAWSDIPRIVYDVNNTFMGKQALSPITNVTDWTQNALTDDITLVGREIAVPGTITVVMNA